MGSGILRELQSRRDDANAMGVGPTVLALRFDDFGLICGSRILFQSHSALGRELRMAIMRITSAADDRQNKRNECRQFDDLNLAITLDSPENVCEQRAEPLE